MNDFEGVENVYKFFLIEVEGIVKEKDFYGGEDIMLVLVEIKFLVEIL